MGIICAAVVFLLSSVLLIGFGVPHDFAAGSQQPTATASPTDTPAQAQPSVTAVDATATPSPGATPTFGGPGPTPTPRATTTPGPTPSPRPRPLRQPRLRPPRHSPGIRDTDLDGYAADNALAISTCIGERHSNQWWISGVVVPLFPPTQITVWNLSGSTMSWAMINQYRFSDNTGGTLGITVPEDSDDHVECIRYLNAMVKSRRTPRPRGVDRDRHLCVRQIVPASGLGVGGQG